MDEHLANKFRPVLVLPKPIDNHGVKPWSIENICAGCNIVNKKGDIVRKAGSFTKDELTVRPLNNSEYSLVPDNNFHPSQMIKDVPFYVGVFHKENNITILQYCFLYPINPGYICGAGFHNGDLEHVTIVIDREREIIKKVYYATHSSAQGSWFPADACEYMYPNRIKVYVAIGSNASYYEPGCYPRIACLANDVCPSTGVLWDPQSVKVVSIMTDPWIYWAGNFGTTTMPARHGFWGREDPPTSITWWQRLFCCCKW